MYRLPLTGTVDLGGEEDGEWNYTSFQAQQQYVYTQCLPTDGCAYLEVTDTCGDGLQIGGYLKFEWGSQVLYDDGNIEDGYYRDIGNGC